MFDKTYLEPSMARANQHRATQACRAKTPQIAAGHCGIVIGNFCMAETIIYQLLGGQIK